MIHAQNGRRSRGVVTQVPVAFNDDPGERRPDLGIGQVVLCGVKPVPGVLDRLFLHLDQQFALADLVVSRLGQINSLVCFFARTSRRPQAFGVRRRSVFGMQRLGKLCLGEVDLRLAVSRAWVTCCWRCVVLASCCASLVNRPYSSSASVSDACAP